jgi:electron transfer flavoprotein alpha subunit
MNIRARIAFSQVTRRLVRTNISSRYASSLVLADHNNKELNENTLSAVTAAAQLGGEIHVLVAGKDCDAVTQSAKAINGVSKVITSTSDEYEHPLGESLCNLVCKCHEANNYSHILASHNNFSKNVLGRCSGILDKPLVPDVTDINGPTKFVRPIYAGNALATFEVNEDTTLMTVRQTAFEAAKNTGGSASTEEFQSAAEFPGSKWIRDAISSNTGPSLSSASKVVSGGRGMKSEDNFKMLSDLASVLGDCAVGASRAAVDAGYASNDLQVGQTGKVVAPELYVAVGISGAIQHMAGMKDSKTIVCINKDPEAPIFQVSDHGLEADLFEAVPELTQKLSS